MLFQTATAAFQLEQLWFVVVIAGILAIAVVVDFLQEKLRNKKGGKK